MVLEKSRSNASSRMKKIVAQMKDAGKIGHGRVRYNRRSDVKTTKVLVVGLACFYLLAFAAFSGQEKAPAFLGVQTELAPGIKPIEGCRAKHGVKVTSVVPDTAAEKVGIEEGDIIVGIGNKNFDADRKSVLQQFRDRIAEFREGDKSTVKVIREETLFEVTENAKLVDPAEDIVTDLKEYMGKKEEGFTLSLTAKKVRRLLVLDVTFGRRPDELTEPREIPPDKEIHPELAGCVGPVEKLADALIKHYKIEEDYNGLRDRLRKIEETTDSFRLHDVVYLHRNPFHMEKVATGILDRIAPSRDNLCGTAEGQLFEAMGLLGLQVERGAREALKTGISPEEHLSQIESVLKCANNYLDKALASLSEEDQKFLREGLLDKENEDFMRKTDVIKLACKIKYEYLYYAAGDLQMLLWPDYLKKLKEDFTKSGADIGGRIVAQKDTPYGKVIIGGTANHWYREDAALIIDLGGDDLYTNNAGASTGKIGCAVLVDLGGSDAYESTRDFVQGTGFLGVGILTDLAGDDSYIGLRWCQGSCLMGIGMLLDGTGSDTYRAHQYAQATALWGVALALDLGGSDRYEAHYRSQALGLPFGIALLANAGGDDSYYSKGTKPTGYGTSGIFDGWSQGCGLGFRNRASGGIAVLLDTEGSDRYEAGNFSQGGGYYYAWGMLNDRGAGNDTYVGSRYAQGFTAHQALGTFIEEGGNDTYRTRRDNVHAGLAWDDCVTLFVDRAGNDTYTGQGGFSQCATAHTSICIFIEGGGKDFYAVGRGPGRSGPNTYHGGTSLSLFLDLGGGEDSYKAYVENNAIKYRPEHSLVVDLPESDIDDLDKVLRFCQPTEEEKKSDK